MKKTSMADLSALVIWLLPAAYLLIVYSSLPAIVPLHYGIDGKANGFGSKEKIIFLQAFISAISAGLYLLFKYLPSIDPKKQVKYGEATFQKLALALVLFMSVLNISITVGAINHVFRADKITLPLIGLLFAFLGNMMHSVKPNYFVGVRTPWTLENEDNWRATHRMAGKLWFIGGIIITALVLVLPAKAAHLVFIPFIVVMAFIPMIYSYIYFKNSRAK
jgi:uncharacterized membrane protein